MIDNSSSTRERRDKKLLIFIIPIGILLMLISGQIAARLTPQWLVNAGMKSNLDPDQIPNQQNAPIQPILPAILTPMSWFETFLTPGAGGTDEPLVFIPFVVIEPSATPNVTPVPPTAATQPSATAPTAAPPTTSPPPATSTNNPPDDEKTPTPPSPTATTPAPTVTTPAPTATGTPSTPPPGYVEVPPDGEIQVNLTPDGTPGHIGGGGLPQYIVIDLGVINSVVVSSTPDGNYDLIFYEYVISPGHIMLDDIIIGISQNPDGSYYEVFNWGDDDDIRDQNTNVDYTKLPADPACASGLECDNRDIPTTVLYGTPPYQSGILIDVDYNTSGKPPEGSYQYLVILAPSSLDASQVDAIVVSEVPGGKFGSTSVQTSEGESQATEEVVTPAETGDMNQSPDPPADEGATSETDPSTIEGSEEQPQSPDPPADEGTTNESDPSAVEGSEEPNEAPESPAEDAATPP